MQDTLDETLDNNEEMEAEAQEEIDKVIFEVTAGKCAAWIVIGQPNTRPLVFSFRYYNAIHIIWQPTTWPWTRRNSLC